MVKKSIRNRSKAIKNAKHYDRSPDYVRVGTAYGGVGIYHRVREDEVVEDGKVKRKSVGKGYH